MLGTSSRDEFSLKAITGSIVVSGNPYVLKPENEWSYTSQSRFSNLTTTGRSRLEGVPVVLGVLGKVQIYRTHTESSYVFHEHSSSSAVKSDSRQTGVPFAAAYGIKRDYSDSSQSSDGSVYRTSDSRETLLSKTGNLDRPGGVLEFAHEIEKTIDSGTMKEIISSRVERLR